VKLLVTVAGLALTFVYAPLGVAVAAVGMYATIFAVLELNVPETRAAFMIAVACEALAVWVASGSIPLGASALALCIPLMPYEAVRRRSMLVDRLLPVLALVTGAVLFALAWPTGWWGIALLPNATMTILVTHKTFAIARGNSEAARGSKLTVGTPMPDITLPMREGGGDFVLSAQRGRHVLLMFVRGDWCPVCHVLMRIISRESETLERYGVRVALISPSEGAVDDELVRRLGLKPGMLLDRDAMVARSLGLVYREQNDGKDVPVPVAVLIDPRGIIQSISRPDDLTDFTTESRVLSLLKGGLATAS
jgi:peroxiredoxin